MMNRVEAVKCLSHPLMAFVLVLGWILLIGSGVEVPATYEGLAVTAAGTWSLKRTYKTYKDLKGG